MNTGRNFDAIVDAVRGRRRIVSLRGGARSGKTFAILQFLIAVSIAEKSPRLTSVCSETYPHLRRGAMRDFLMIMQGEGLFNPSRWNKSESTYTFENGSQIEFFSVENAGKVHGAARDRLFINECQNIKEETARQLFIRTRRLIILDYNPTHHFWLTDEVEARPDTARIVSTYRDNPFLSKGIIQEIEANKGRGNWWRVYGEGEIGAAEGLIFQNYETIDAAPAGLIEVVGVDFGFSHDPTAIIKCSIDSKTQTVYLDELCYSVGMLNRDIIEKLQSVRNLTIYADCAEPKSIAELKEAGLYVKASNKGAPSPQRKAWQLRWLQGWRIFVVGDSANLKRELNCYIWAVNGAPEDGNDHAIDAFRYAVYSKMAGAMSKNRISIC